MNNPDAFSPHSRRHFLKYSTLAVGASFLTVPEFIYGSPGWKLKLRGVVQSPVFQSLATRDQCIH